MEGALPYGPYDSPREEESGETVINQRESDFLTILPVTRNNTVTDISTSLMTIFGRDSISDPLANRFKTKLYNKAFIPCKNSFRMIHK